MIKLVALNKNELKKSSFSCLKHISHIIFLLSIHFWEVKCNIITCNKITIFHNYRNACMRFYLGESCWLYIVKWKSLNISIYLWETSAIYMYFGGINRWNILFQVKSFFNTCYSTSYHAIYALSNSCKYM